MTKLESEADRDMIVACIGKYPMIDDEGKPLNLAQASQLLEKLGPLQARVQAAEIEAPKCDTD